VSNALVDLLQFREEFTVFVHDSLVKSSQKGHKDVFVNIGVAP
jgi:hypothetical protein